METQRRQTETADDDGIHLLTSTLAPCVEAGLL